MSNTCLALAAWIAYFVPPITHDGVQPQSNPSSGRTAATQVLVEIAISERATPDSVPRTLVNPAIVVTPGVPFRFHSGGEVQPKHVGDALQIGTAVEGVVSAEANGKHRLDLKVNVSHQIESDNKFADVVQTNGVEIRTVMLPASTQEFALSNRKRCTIRLEAIASPKPDPKGSAQGSSTSSKRQTP